MGPYRLRFLPGLVLFLAALAACTPAPTPTPTPTVEHPLPSPSPTGNPIPLTPIVDAPERDWLDLVKRYRGVTVEPLDEGALYPDEPVGARRDFWVIEIDGPRMARISAELRHVSERALWYVADGIEVDGSALEEAARSFDDDIYPRVSGLFAPSVVVPGRITVVNADLPGLGGYFSGADLLPAEAHRFSNERTTLFMNGRIDVGGRGYMGTLAHELQHLLHARVDPDEVTWVNEGLSELAAKLLGLPALPADAYLRDPAVSLTNWPQEPAASLPNYAAGSLFSAYLAERTGIHNLHRLVAEQEDGIEGVEAYLDGVAEGLSFAALYADWLAANVIGASSGVYGYADLSRTVRVDRLLEGPGSVTGRVPQLGGWYLRIGPGETPLAVEFHGNTSTPVLPVEAHSGETCWWSNRGDGIDSSLTRQLDLTRVSEATLRFWSWYDIEAEWDRGYVAVSVDNGQTWRALEGRFTSVDDPVGSSLGPSYTGASNGWREDEVSLTPYAGRTVLLRFNYVTDESINAAGWCIDDIAIDAVGLFDDAEGDGGWRAEGFVRATSRGIAQRFIVRAVTGAGSDAQVSTIEVDPANRARFTVMEPTIVIVSPIAPETTQPATFRLTALAAGTQ